jgi:predicted DNA-binding protein
MRRTQLYLTDEQRERIAQRAEDAGVSQAEIVRRLIDEALGLGSDMGDRLDAVDATSGILADHPDWKEWLADVRGGDARERLEELGL